MASKGDTEVSLDKATKLMGSALVVFRQCDGAKQEREQEEKGEKDAGQASCLVLNVTFKAHYEPTSSVLFWFRVNVFDETPVYLQLLPDKVSDLLLSSPSTEADLCTSLVSIPEDFDLKQTRCLEFTLCGAGDLIVPENFEPISSDTEGCHNIRHLASLATASSIQVYIRKKALTRTKFETFRAALAAAKGLSDEKREALKRRADPMRFDGGRVGVMVDPAGLLDSLASCAHAAPLGAPPPYSPRCPSSPALYAASCASTVPAATPPPSVYRDLTKADTLASPTCEQDKFAGKRARSPDGDSDARDGQHKIQRPSGAVTTTGFMDQKLMKAANRNFTGLEKTFLETTGYLVDEVKSLQKGMSELKAQNAQQQQQIEDLMAQNAQQQQQIKNLMAQNAQQQQQMNELNNNPSFAQGVIDTTMMRQYVNQVVELAIAPWREEFGAGEEALETLQARVDVVEKDVEVLDSHLACAGDGIDRLDECLTATKNDVEALEGDFKVLADRVTTVESNPRETSVQVLDMIARRLTTSWQE